MPQYCLAYLAQGKLHLHDGAGTPRVLESAFGRSLRERAAQIYNRRAWKTRGFGAQFMRLNQRMPEERDAAEFPIAVTSVARGRTPGEVLYSLQTNEISGVFAVDSSGFEQRLFHTADFRVRNLAAHPDGSAIAVSVSHGNAGANIALLNGDGADFREASEGDSLDLAPQWAPGPGRRLVFQSAGLGRDAAGHFSGRGPFAIQQLDLESGELVCLAENPESDLLGPQMAADGGLYYVRRPFGNKPPDAKPLDALKETLLLPVHLAAGVLNFLQLFAIFFGGKRMRSTDSAERQQVAEQIMAWGEPIPLDRAAFEKRHGETEAPSLVPSSWQLIRQSANGQAGAQQAGTQEAGTQEAGTQEVLANGVLSFDIAPDGSVLYSNGRAVHRIEPQGARTVRVFVGDMIEQVAALSLEL